jgi:hypothetical protein
MPINDTPHLKKRWFEHSLSLLEISLVMIDLVPFISEPIRFGTLFIVQGSFHNILLSGVAFGGITFILDALGAVAVADLLSKQITTTIIAKANSTIKLMGLGKLLSAKTNMIIDVGITLLVGTPITLILKQRDNPARTREDNIRLGIFLSAVATIVSVLQGSAIVAGFWHPNAITIGLGVIVVGSYVVIDRWLRRLFK